MKHALFDDEKLIAYKAYRDAKCDQVSPKREIFYDKWQTTNYYLCSSRNLQKKAKVVKHTWGAFLLSKIDKVSASGM